MRAPSLTPGSANRSTPLRAALVLLAVSAGAVYGQGIADLGAGREAFEIHCGSCHGGDGRGGEYAPDIVTPGIAAGRSDNDLRAIIRDGLPDRGMPAIGVSEPEVTQLVAYFASLTRPASVSPLTGDPERGAQVFRQSGCADCHLRGPGAKVVGPDLAWVGSERMLHEIQRAIAEPDARIAEGYGVVEVHLRSGETVQGFARNRSATDIQLQAFDGSFRFLSAGEIDSIRERPGSLMPTASLSARDSADLIAFLSRQDGEGSLARDRPTAQSEAGVPFERILHPRPGEWPTYNGRLDGNRHSQLDQIHAGNVDRLEIAWVYPLDSPNLLETTPVVADGVMYVTFANELHALDALHGRRVWRYSQPRTPHILGAAARAANRGVALLGDRVFMVTDHAHLLALDRVTGRKLWDTRMADHRENYNATTAPLVVKDMVVSGISGGDQGVRGFVAAYDPATGAERWRFWTVPLPGEPLAET